MEWFVRQAKKNEAYKERHQLSTDRLKTVVTEETTGEKYCPYFQMMAAFLLELEAVRRKVESGAFSAMEISDMKEINDTLYADIVGKAYEKSYANPTYAPKSWGKSWECC